MSHAAGKNKDPPSRDPCRHSVHYKFSESVHSTCTQELSWQCRCCLLKLGDTLVDPLRILPQGFDFALAQELLPGNNHNYVDEWRLRHSRRSVRADGHALCVRAGSLRRCHNRKTRPVSALFEQHVRTIGHRALPTPSHVRFCDDMACNLTSKDIL